MNYIKYWTILIALISSISASAQETTSITVHGACGMCQDRIETAALQVIGVETADWDNASQKLTVTHSSFFDVHELHQKMASIGHDTDLITASDEVYENLHMCCKYRDEEVHEDSGLHDATTRIIENMEAHDHELEDQNWVHGMIYESTALEKNVPLIGANINWLGSSEGTSTDLEGFFELRRNNQESRLVISYVGYENDTIDIGGQSIVAIKLNSDGIVINTVDITYKRKTTEISFIDPLKVHTLSEKELCKAACCNLSESFETTPNVDVASTDAVTGTRTIQMLGLAGPNIQIMFENMPFVRGLGALYGMEFIPGTWVESIQLNQGTGSVVNGPESMTGQINVELRKPETADRLYVNLFANMVGRLEANVHTGTKVNDRWHTATLLHGKWQSQEVDQNHDHFMDIPNDRNLYITNRWRYNNGKGLMGQFGVRGTIFNKESGQTSHILASERWTANYQTNRVDLWAKVGKVFQDRPYSSIGFQLAYSNHDQDANFGQRNYIANQHTLYSNLIYQTIISNPNHIFKVGASGQWDVVDESVATFTFNRDEKLIGAFAEYTLSGGGPVSLIAGIRADHHNNFGLFFTPRLHINYRPTEHTSLRLTAGRGQRTPSIFAENIGFLASNRKIELDQTNINNPYGMVPDIAWTIGGSITQEIHMGEVTTTLGADYYYSYSDQKVVVDYDFDSRIVQFYPLNGTATAHSIQLQSDTDLGKGLSVRLAYRYNDPRTDFGNRGAESIENRSNPLIKNHRAFVNIAWEAPTGWTFDWTSNLMGSSRLPITSNDPVAFQMIGNSPTFSTSNAQVTKRIRNGMEFYLGGENIFGFSQDDPIRSVSDPTNPYFDASMIWGPIMGGMYYVGMRYRIP